MARPRIDDTLGRDAVRRELAAAADGSTGDRASAALATRWLLQLLMDAAPGNTLEVRVPPHGAAQVLEGPRHTRGTPPNVIEMDAATWLQLATGGLGWDAARATHRASASGQRADLSGLVPLTWDA